MAQKVETIKVEPNWLSIYKYFMCMKESNPGQFDICVKEIGEDEWAKLEKIAQV